MATLYTNDNGYSPYYTCSVSYGTVTRSGTTVTVPSVTLTMTRGDGYWTGNRLAYCAGKSSGGTDIASNVTIKGSGSQSAASYSVNIGDVTYTNNTSTSVHLYVAVASTGGSSYWNNFQGNSPVTVFDADISCPAAYPTFTTQPSASAINETSVSLNLGTVNISSYMYYKVGSGSWVYASTNPVTITGLSAGTSYSLTVQARNSADTSLTTNSNAISVSTYANPSIASWPSNITMDSATKNATFTFNNPLGRTITMSASIGNYSVSGTTTGTSGTLTLNCDSIYNQIPSATSGTITYSALSSSATKTISASESYAKPTVLLDGFVYSAVHDSSFGAIYSDTSKIIQNHSYLKVRHTGSSASDFSTIGVANKGAASITGATITFCGQNAQTLTNSLAAYISTSTKFNYSNTQAATVTVTDSRGYTNTATVNIPFIAYQNPVASISANRVGGFSEDLILILSGSFSDMESNNYITGLEYKVGDSGSWTSATVVNNQATVSGLTLDPSLSQIYYVRATDRVGVVSDAAAAIIDIGQAITFIDSQYNAVGINCYPGSTQKGLVLSNDSSIYIGAQDLVTALKAQIINTIYPVGAIYMSLDNTNPGTLFGVGTWEQITDKFLVAAGTYFTMSAPTGGASSVTLQTANLPSHNHSFTGSTVSTDSQGSHEHWFYPKLQWQNSSVQSNGNVVRTSSGWAPDLAGNLSGPMTVNYNSLSQGTGYAGEHTHSITCGGTVGNTGSGTAFSIIPPYQVVYIWKRVNDPTP